MKIVVDQYIPFIVEAVRDEWPQVDIYPLKPEQIDAEAVREADILVVRTRTRVDESLLKGSRVRMICTATIGYDHIDTAYCLSHGIRWMSCPGCNAQAVCDYIEEALEEIQNSYPKGTIIPKFKIQTSTPTIGVVGVGHVGSLVAQMAEQKGMNVLLNDPPKGIGVSLDEIAKDCDIITFHVPLDKTTYHLCDEAFLQQCKPKALIINAARGGVVDEQALLRSGHPYILDTWENEPDLNKVVLERALRASMHIAGYSEEGKRNASQMCLDAISEEYGLKKISLPESRFFSCGDTNPGWLARITDQLKAHPSDFEGLRKNYALR